MAQASGPRADDTPESPPRASIAAGMACRSSVASMGSDVQVAHVLGVPLDELAPRLDLVAHELVEELGGLDRVLHGDPENGPRGRVHRGLPELVRVHLTEPLVPLDVDVSPALAVGEALGVLVPLALAVGVELLLGLGHPVERRLG